MKSLKFALIALACIAGGAALYALLTSGHEKDVQSGESYRVGTDAPVAGPDGGSGRERKKSGRKVTRRPIAHVDAKLNLIKELNIDAEEEERLSAEQKALLDEIRRVFDMDDRAGLIRIVQRMQKSDEWPDGIPISIRKAAIDALAWFGHDCIPEMLGFVADPDEEIQQASLDAYEQALFEANGDLELSQLVIAAAKVVNDFDAMDSMLMWLNDMRPSRMVETVKEIWRSGTQAAQKAMGENLEFLTGEEGIDSPEKLDNWYNDPSGDNRDDEDAEEFYGPQTED